MTRVIRRAATPPRTWQPTTTARGPTCRRGIRVVKSSAEVVHPRRVGRVRSGLVVRKARREMRSGAMAEFD